MLLGRELNAMEFIALRIEILFPENWLGCGINFPVSLENAGESTFLVLNSDRIVEYNPLGCARFDII